MSTINYKKGDSVQLVVNRADNILTAYLAESSTNRRQVYGRDTDYAVQFKDTIDLAPSLRQSSESLLLTGTNFTGGGQIYFQILVNNTVQAQVNDDLPANTSKSWEFALKQS